MSKAPDGNLSDTKRRPPTGQQQPPKTEPATPDLRSDEHAISSSGSEETLMSGTQPHKHSKASRSKSWPHIARRARATWLWEISGAALGIACMVAILVILPYLDDKPLKNWRFVMAPNTMISTFITVAKTSTLLVVTAGLSQLKWLHYQRESRPISDLDTYDNASRGPMGALVFILWMSFRTGALIATLGAFIVISSLTMEPFAQQILSFQTRDLPHDGGIGWISTAVNYTHGSNSDGELDGTNTVFQTALLTALVDAPISLSYTCTTGNCTWPDFHALGVCSSCRNVTSESSLERITLLAPDTTKNESGISRDQLLYTTPGGNLLNISAPWDIYRGTEDYHIVGKGHLMTGSVNDQYGGIANDSATKFPLPTIAHVAVANNSGTELGSTSMTSDITECTLSWCAKLHKKVEVINGILNDYEVEDIPLAAMTPSDRPTDDFCADKHSTHPLPSTYTFSTAATPGNFTVSCSDQLALDISLRAYMNFNFTDSGSTTVPFNTGRFLHAQHATVDSAIAKVARALTMQVLSGPTSTRHGGVARSTDVHVVVRWGWIAFPALLVVLAALFLAANLWVGRRQRTSPHWKSSLVPFLFHGLSGTVEDEVDVNERVEMDARAQGMRVRLEKNDEGVLKFVRD